MNRYHAANHPDEIIDVVDENDQIIGQSTRAEVNSNPKLIHREVGIIIYNQELKVLFQKRSQYKDVNPSTWSTSCAGHIESGEDLDQAAHRELQEELGFDTKLQFLEKRLVSLANETYFKYWFLGQHSGQPIHINLYEVEQVLFLDQHMIKQMKGRGERFFPNFLNIVEEFWQQKLDIAS